MNSIPDIFRTPPLDQDRLKKPDALTEPKRRSLIAMSLRSGSSYLCHTMKSKRFGSPDEVINQELIPGITKKVPGDTPDGFLRNFIQERKDRNGISGFKASWLQDQSFSPDMAYPGYLTGFR